MTFTSKESRQIIEQGMRELFPRILPSRLQEARASLLHHLNMTKDDFGHFPSGQPKFDNYCSQVVKSLKATGDMTTQGWRWIWSSVEQPVEQAHTWSMFMDDLDDLLEDEVEETPSLYNLECEDTVIRLVASTPCFGKVAQAETECQQCPLFDLCIEKKGEVRQAKRAAKTARGEALELASQAGYDLSGVKPPKAAKLHEITEYTLKSNSHCIVSGEELLAGDIVYHIPSWGLVNKTIGESYKALNEI